MFNLRIVFKAAILFMAMCASLAAASVAAGHLKPNGRQIAYVVQGRDIQAIYAYDLDAQQTAALTRTSFGYCCGPVAWSPDRKQLVVTYTPTSGMVEFYIITVNGQFRHRLRSQNELTSIESLAWSPDGRYLAYEVWGTGSISIYRMDVDGAGESTRLTALHQHNFGAAWSPDGQQIVFSSLQAGGSTIFVMNADGSNPHPLSPLTASLHQPSWSPDGGRIAFLQNSGAAWDVLVMNSDGSGLRQMTQEAHVVSPLEWSPDGQRIAYAGLVDDNAEIFVVDVTTGIQQRLTSTTAREYSPMWSPDGRQIIFTRSQNNNYDISLMNADGSDDQSVIRSPRHDFAPVWLEFGD